MPMHAVCVTPTRILYPAARARNCSSFSASSSGEGGIVTTNDDDLADRLRTFRTHCIRKVPEQGGWYYEIEELGFNYRLTDLQAALGTSQMTKLDASGSARRWQG